MFTLTRLSITRSETCLAGPGLFCRLGLGQGFHKLLHSLAEARVDELRIHSLGSNLFVLLSKQFLLGLLVSDNPETVVDVAFERQCLRASKIVLVILAHDGDLVEQVAVKVLRELLVLAIGLVQVTQGLAMGSIY